MDHEQTQLARRLAETLDQSGERFAPDVLQQLAQARRDALAMKPARQYHWRGSQWGAMAAMLCVCALMLGVSYRLVPASMSADVTASGVLPGGDAYLQEHPEMLSDWEMLDAIGEDPDAG